MAEYKRTLIAEYIFDGQRTQPGTEITLSREQFDRAVASQVIEADEERDAEVRARYEARTREAEERNAANAVEGTTPARPRPARRSQRYSGGKPSEQAVAAQKKSAGRFGKRARSE